MGNNQDDSTIREDVQNTTGIGSSDEQGTTTEQTPENRTMTPREEAMARIEQANLERIERQNSDYRKASGEAEPTPYEGRQTEAQPVAAEAGTKVRVKVDGEEMELPISEVIKGYQKDATADKRLKEAALRLQQIEERERELTQRTEQRTEQSDTPSRSDETVRDKARAIIDAMMEADPDTAVNTLADVLGTSRSETPQLDQGAVADMVNGALRQQAFEREFQEAQAQFQRDHADLNDNPHLANMVNQLYEEARQTGAFPKAATEYAVTEVRKFIQSITGNPAVGGVSPSRQERKQTYDTITRAGGRTDSGASSQPDNTAAIIADMKRLRGQA